MDEWSRFELTGHRFVAYLPSTDREEPVFTLVVTGPDGAEVRRERIPLGYRPVFGPDAEDVAQLNQRVEEAIRELGLEDDDALPSGAKPEGEGAM